MSVRLHAYVLFVDQSVNISVENRTSHAKNSKTNFELFFSSEYCFFNFYFKTCLIEKPKYQVSILIIQPPCMYFSSENLWPCRIFVLPVYAFTPEDLSAAHKLLENIIVRDVLCR